MGSSVNAAIVAAALLHVFLCHALRPPPTRDHGGKAGEMGLLPCFQGLFFSPRSLLRSPHPSSKCSRINNMAVRSMKGNGEYIDTAKEVAASEDMSGANRTLSECIDDEAERRARADHGPIIEMGGEATGFKEAEVRPPGAATDAVENSPNSESALRGSVRSLQRQSNLKDSFAINPGGALEALAVAMQNGLEKAGPWLRRWPKNEEREIPLVLSRMQEQAAVTLGQKTVIQLPEPERMRVIAGMRETKSNAVFLGFVDDNEQRDLKNDTSSNITLVGYVAVAETTDVHLLDKTGEMGVKLVGRVKVQGIASSTAGNVRVRAVPWWDSRQPFSHPGAAKDIIAAIHSLYERATKLELTYRKLQGKYDQAHLVSIRPPLSDTVSEQLADINAPTEHEIAEVLSFCALDFHVDVRTRCWANSQQDTEVRLGLARRSLELKITRLQADIKLLKEQSEFQQCQKNGTPTSSPPEGVSLSSMPGAPAPPEIVFADIPRD